MDVNIGRFTTEYIDTEDRLRLAGEGAAGVPVVIWLTQRLLARAIPPLLLWLEQQGAALPRAEVAHSWAQQAARAALAPAPPVRPAIDTVAWLAQRIDVTFGADRVLLVFRSEQEDVATLPLATLPLRQWLNILHDAHVAADWPLAAWPDWVRESAMPAPGKAVVLH